ncbi:putative transcriptional regulator [Xenococcus sp. PCC 7305]|uniref:pentapeptide repeat-containing protein n=1 Tax=Xenococcus sp. PCC 7305 TaxID=102125 RepID=UPI0002AC7AA8|nr:pentapeptide repeat-containing protein [Xenococcus sp. PCC 7305]ELS05157.1 putative transcriptional regulator [Xenococcus sp. PCC 7305]
MSSGLLIGELANQFGLSTQAIRYYERLGLLTTPQRTDNGYRLYSQEALERLKFIRKAQNFGLSLQEIKQLIELDIYSPSSHVAFKKMLQGHLQEIDQQIYKLTNTSQILRRKFEQTNYLIPEPGKVYSLSDYQGSLLSLMEEVEKKAQINHKANLIDKAYNLLQLYSSGERNFRGIELIGAKLNEAILNGCDLSCAELMLASLNEACLEKTKLQGSYLSGADLIGADLREAELTRADLIGSDLTDADLTNSHLISCNLGGACLKNASLKGANLSEAILIGADLQGADLTGAMVLGSNFYGANLEGAKGDLRDIETFQD